METTINIPPDFAEIHSKCVFEPSKQHPILAEHVGKFVACVGFNCKEFEIVSVGVPGESLSSKHPVLLSNGETYTLEGQSLVNNYRPYADILYVYSKEWSARLKALQLRDSSRQAAAIKNGEAH